MDTNESTLTTDATQDKNTASTPTQTGAANPGPTEAKFTQADLEREIAARLERADKREARVKAELLKQLGLAEDADIESTKSTIAKARELEQANLTATERAQKDVEAALKRASDLESQLNAERTERRNDRIHAAVVRAASALKANDTDDVVRYARDKHPDALNALVDASGGIDEKALTGLLDKIKAEKAHYFTPVNVGFSPSNIGGRVVQGDVKAKEKGVLSTRRTIQSGF